MYPKPLWKLPTPPSVTSVEAYAPLTLYLSLFITNNNIAPLGAQG